MPYKYLKKLFAYKIFFFCCSKLLRWPTKYALSTCTSASSTIHLPIIRRNVFISGFSIIDTATTSDSDADIDIDIIIVGDNCGGGIYDDDDSSFNSVNNVSYESADASATRDVR